MPVISEINIFGENRIRMSNKVDFTGCRQFLGRAYNGANGKKIAVEYSGDIYICLNFRLRVKKSLRICRT